MIKRLYDLGIILLLLLEFLLKNYVVTIKILK